MGLFSSKNNPDMVIHVGKILERCKADSFGQAVVTAEECKCKDDKELDKYYNSLVDYLATLVGVQCVTNKGILFVFKEDEI